MSAAWVAVHFDGDVGPMPAACAAIFNQQADVAQTRAALKTTLVKIYDSRRQAEHVTEDQAAARPVSG